MTASGEPDTKIFKILRVPEWQAFQVAKRFEGSSDDLRDGFIHCSTQAQLAGTLEKYFSGDAEVVIMEMAVEPFGDVLKWEPSRNGSLFPHLFGTLQLDHVAAVSVRTSPG